MMNDLMMRWNMSVLDEHNLCDSGGFSHHQFSYAALLIDRFHCPISRYRPEYSLKLSFEI